MTNEKSSGRRYAVNLLVIIVMCLVLTMLIAGVASWINGKPFFTNFLSAGFVSTSFVLIAYVVPRFVNCERQLRVKEGKCAGLEKELVTEQHKLYNANTFIVEFMTLQSVSCRLEQLQKSYLESVEAARAGLFCQLDVGAETRSQLSQAGELIERAHMRVRQASDYVRTAHRIALDRGVDLGPVEKYLSWPD